MRKFIPEGTDPFAERPPFKGRVIKSLAITVVVLAVATGGLVWFRFQPAFTKEGQAAITIDQPAWGTANALVSRAPETVGLTSAPESPMQVQARDREKAKRSQAKARNPSSKAPPQVARTPAGN